MYRVTAEPSSGTVALKPPPYMWYSRPIVLFASADSRLPTPFRLVTMVMLSAYS